MPDLGETILRLALRLLKKVVVSLLLSTLTTSFFMLCMLIKSEMPFDGDDASSSPLDEGFLWRPPSVLLQDWRNRAPFHHCPHGTAKRNNTLQHLADMVENPRSVFSCKCPPLNVLPIFINTEHPHQEALLEKSLKRCGCPYQRIGGPIKGHFTWNMKIEFILEYLHRDEVPSNVDYLLYLDSFDHVLFGDASNVTSNFRMYNCDLLTVGTRVNWPPSLIHKAFEDFVYPWTRNHQHPSAGAFMASPDNMQRYMNIMLQDYRDQKSLRVKRIGKIIWDDQLALRELHRKKYPRIKVDTLSLIFTVMDVNMNEL